MAGCFGAESSGSFPGVQRTCQYSRSRLAISAQCLAACRGADTVDWFLPAFGLCTSACSGLPLADAVLALDSRCPAGSGPERSRADLRAIRSTRFALGKPIWTSAQCQADSGPALAGFGSLQPLSSDSSRLATA